MDYFCYKLLIDRDFKLEKYNCYDDNHVAFMNSLKPKSKKSNELEKLSNYFIISINDEYKGYIWFSELIRYNNTIIMNYSLKRGISNKIASISYMNEITNFLIKKEYTKLISFRPNSLFQKVVAEQNGFKKRYSILLDENVYYKDQVTNKVK